MDLLTYAQDLDQGSTLLYGSLSGGAPRRGLRPIAPELLATREKLLWAGFNVLLKDHYRDHERLGRIESHLHRLLSDEDRSFLMRIPLEIAVALSTPDLPQAHLARLRLYKPGRSIRCTRCEEPIFATDEVFMKEHCEPRPPRVCMRCVKRQARITLPVEWGEEFALGWIQHRLTELGRLPREQAR